MEKRYGIIGKSLPHSYSKIIHEHLFNKKYDIIELNEKEFDVFIKHKSFSGVNITIPYKQKIIPYLDFIDEHAKKIGAVNTVLNKNGKLYDENGFNIKGIHRNGTLYNDEGYDKDGFNKSGIHRNGKM